jgi:hypothetical protein
LNQFGHFARLRIGVAKDTAQGLRAHAWVEHEGKLLIGGSEQLSRFHPLISKNGPSVTLLDANG